MSPPRGRPKEGLLPLGGTARSAKGARVNPSRRLALALGDPNGVGPEIALKALAGLSGRARRGVTVYGPAQVLERAAATCGLAPLLQDLAHVEAGTIVATEAVPGQVSAAAGASAVAAATAAIQACRAGQADAVIACPHNETAIHRAGIRFSGYPSLLATVCGVPEDEVFLMLVGGGLRIVHATLHESVRTALARLSTELVVSATRAGVLACRHLGVFEPSVGLFGINPHASEGGLFGREDEEIVAPAAMALRAEGHRIDGPHGADMLLSQRRHDLYVAMLHDQGHIPVKLLAPNAASALSIGAGVLLCSTGHGSAMDIAGRGIADPAALVHAIGLVGGAMAAGQAG